MMLTENETELMASTLYLLSLCVVTAIQLTSSQDMMSCADTEQALNQLITLNSQLMNVVSQLQKDVQQVKTDSRQKDTRSMLLRPVQVVAL